MSRRHAGAVKLGFEQLTRTLPIAAIAPLHLVSDAVKATPKYGQIVASIREIGVVEPPVVVRDRREPGKFLLLDGHLRIEALKDMGRTIVQDQILHRIKTIHAELNKTMLLITHDMAVVAENCDKIVVMYAGKVMEYGGEAVFQRPYHPYTMGLCNAFPDLEESDRDLISIPGAPPSLIDAPPGCRFAARCPFATARCAVDEPSLAEIEPGHFAACHYTDRAPDFRRAARNPATWRQLEIERPE
jgi:oligopeptide/dipeptide ABC transporter ATP-binding protein